MIVVYKRRGTQAIAGCTIENSKVGEFLAELISIHGAIRIELDKE